MRSERLALRLAALILIIGILGLPIDDVAAYGLLVAAALVVFTGSLTTRPARWIAAAALAAAVIAAHLWWPAPRIEEGHNAFLPGPRIAETSGLPADVVGVMSRQFDEEYPPDKRCNDRNRGCWRPDRSGEADGFAFSADAVFDHPAYSRRVAGIGFSDPADLRLGFINDYAYGWPDNWSDIKRFERDRHSLNLFDRYRVTFPLFVMYVLPADFAGSTLCWRGTVLWEGPDAHFETITAADRRCRDITPDDAGRRIFAVSIKRDVRLAMTLEPNATILFGRAIGWGLKLAGTIGMVILLVRIEPRRLALPAILIGFALLTTLFVDASFIGGFRPLDSGDDGIAYEGFGRAIVRHLLSGDLAAAIKGVEPVYYFTPGFRYVRALELFVFGETFLLYLSAILALPVLVLGLFRRFLPPRWALVLVLGFAATPIGALFGSSLFQYVVWASRGYSDPFAAVLLVAATLLVVPKQATGEAPGLRRIFAAGLLFAAAAFCRPNLVLAAGTMVAGAAAIWIANRQWGRAAALAAGFTALALSPLHNYVFANVFVLFSDNVNQPQTLLMSPLDYAKAAYEIVTLDFAGEHVKRALAQLYRWLSGPEELAVMVPIHALAVATLVRVGVFGARFDPWLRVVALATLLQHGIGATYVNFARYNLGTWLMTMMVTAAWLDREGLALLCRRLPGVCEAWRRNAVVRRLSTMVGTWADWVGLGEAAPGRNAAHIRPGYDNRLHHERSR
jgi:hypothetical protein